MAMAWTGASLETGMMTRAVFCSTSVEPLLGRTTSLAWYSLSRWTLRWRFSADLFLRLLSMQMPTWAALAARAARLATFLAGWLNQVLASLGQIFLLRKWALGRTRLRWTAIFWYYFCKFDLRL